MKDQDPPRPASAVALHYDEVDAPKLTAKAEGRLAEEIIELARRHGVPLYENSELVRLLSTLDLGDEIPEALYLTIAEIIAFAYVIRERFPKDWQPDATPENEP